MKYRIQPEEGWYFDEETMQLRSIDNQAVAIDVTLDEARTLAFIQTISDHMAPYLLDDEQGEPIYLGGIIDD